MVNDSIRFKKKIPGLLYDHCTLETGQVKCTKMSNLYCEIIR